MVCIFKLNFISNYAPTREGGWAVGDTGGLCCPHLGLNLPTTWIQRQPLSKLASSLGSNPRHHRAQGKPPPPRAAASPGPRALVVLSGHSTPTLTPLGSLL